MQTNDFSGHIVHFLLTSSKRIFICSLLELLSSLYPRDNLSVQNESRNEHLLLKDYLATGVNCLLYVCCPWDAFNNQEMPCIAIIIAENY